MLKKFMVQVNIPVDKVGLKETGGVFNSFYPYYHIYSFFSYICFERNFSFVYLLDLKKKEIKMETDKLKGIAI